MTSRESPMIVLQRTDPNKSILHALNNSNETQLFQNASKVFDFMMSHLDDTNPETLSLIEYNLIYLAAHFKIACSQNDLDIFSNRIELWMKCGVGLHNLMMNIIKKHKDTVWMKLNNNRHAICIYFALQIIGFVLIANSDQVSIFIDNSDTLKILLEILNCSNNANNITWIEKFACTRSLLQLSSWIIQKNPELFVKVSAKYGLNIVKLLIEENCNCFKLQYMYNNLSDHQKYILWIVTNQIHLDIEDMMYVKSQFAEQNKDTTIIHALAYRQRVNSTVFLHKLASIQNDSVIEILFNVTDITTKYLKRLLQICILYMRKSKLDAVKPNINTIDIISVLSQHRFIAKQLVSDEEIIELLLIGCRSRAQFCEFNYREIIIILYNIIFVHKLLPRKYYHDSIVVLMDIKEIPWKACSVQTVYAQKSSSILVIKTLKYLFGIFEWNIEHKDEYLCAICQHVVQLPHTNQCGHFFCYGCFRVMIGCDSNNNQSKQCPLCRSPVIGRFARHALERSEFGLDKKLQNKMNAENIIIINENQEEKKSNDIFEGNEYEYWKYLEINHVDTLYDEQMAQNKVSISQFVAFCKFMQHKTKIYDQNDNIELKEKQQIEKAIKIKQKGNRFISQQKYEKALVQYKKALAVCPIDQIEDRATYYSNITITLTKMNNYKDAFHASQEGLILLPVNHKLLYNGITALNNVLKNCHGENTLDSVIQIGPNNLLCPNRRLFDIILFQHIFTFESFYVQQQAMKNRMMIRNIEEHQQYTKSLKLTDPKLLKLERISSQIQNYCAIHEDDSQYQCYVDTVNDIAVEIGQHIIALIKNANYDITIDAIMNTVNSMFTMHPKKALIENLMQNKPFITSIVNASNCLSMDNETGIIELFLEDDNKNDDQTYETKHRCCFINDNVVSCCFYEWEHK